MSAHIYKKVATKPAAAELFSFVAAVKEYGDEWKLAAPGSLARGLYADCRTPDDRDASLMRLMERGSIPRIDIMLAITLTASES